MGRAFRFLSIWAAVVCLDFVVPSPALFGAGLLPPLHTADSWDELDTWMDELCSFVHCELNGLLGSCLTTEDNAISFVLTYDIYGRRHDLTIDQRQRGQDITSTLLQMLDKNPGVLDPAIQNALVESLLVLHDDLAQS